MHQSPVIPSSAMAKPHATPIHCHGWHEYHIGLAQFPCAHRRNPLIGASAGSGASVCDNRAVAQRPAAHCKLLPADGQQLAIARWSGVVWDAAIWQGLCIMHGGGDDSPAVCCQPREQSCGVGFVRGGDKSGCRALGCSLGYSRGGSLDHFAVLALGLC